MTQPTLFDNDTDYELLRKRWLNKYLNVENVTTSQLRVVLIQAAEDAQAVLNSLASSTTFSSSVKSAQLRLLMREIRQITNDIFNKSIPIIEAGQKQSANAAVSAFSQTDFDYLQRAFGNRSDARDFVNGQRAESMVGINNAISRLEKSKQPLSSRVYQSRRLANNWVERKITSALMRSASAKELAREVRNSIRPSAPGGVSYSAMRLARTELNNAFHATTISLADDRPWVEGMRWRLSQTHDAKEQCRCTSYSDLIFTVGEVPKKPHPQCRCFVTPEVEPWESFVTNLTAGQYRNWVANAA